MPIYAYRCESCGFGKDVLQKLSDAPLKHCPECGKETFAKQVTAAGFQLKGSGWYVTDFRGGNGAKPGSAAPAAGAATGDTAKSDAPASGASESSTKSESSGASAESSKSGGAASTPSSTPASSSGAA
jgi:putative FmdB family regulatory protein